MRFTTLSGIRWVCFTRLTGVGCFDLNFSTPGSSFISRRVLSELIFRIPESSVIV